MRIFITNTQFYTSLFLFSFAIIHYIYFLIWDIKDVIKYLKSPSEFTGKIRLKFMTWWNLYINSFYFIIVLICDLFFFFKRRQLETINFFFREHFSPICTTLTILVTIVFWFLIYLPMKIQNKIKGEMAFNYMNVYVHLLITIIQIVDIFLAQKTFMKFNLKHFYGLSFLFFCYGIVVGVEKFVNNNSIYPFFDLLKWWNIIFFVLFFVGFYFVIYKYCYLYLIKIKYQKKIFILEDEENVKIEDVENKIKNNETENDNKNLV